MAHISNTSATAVLDAHPSPAISSQTPPSAAERRALIERVASSEQFIRSVRLRDFLLYVGRQSLKEGCPDVHEEEIGIRVFGRPASYDRSQDNIVRVNATELRKRIDAWFAGPGTNEPLIFEIPRGTYKPIFRWRTPELALAAVPTPAPKEAHTSATSLAVDVPSTSRRFLTALSVERIAWLATCLALAALTGFLFFDNHNLRTLLRPWQNQPTVNAFWQSFLDQNRQTDLVLPDDSVSVIEDITAKPISINTYLSRDFMREIQSSQLSTDRKQDLYQVFNHNLVTFGAVRAAQYVLTHIPATYPHYLTLARNFTADEFNRSNVVFLGGEKAMPWDHLIDDMLNFSTDYDYKNNVAFVRNRNPKPGEPPTFTISSSPDSIIGYAVIAYLPNPNRTGHVLLLAGTDSDSTGAAAAFLSSENQIEKLRAVLHKKTFPYFEVVLKVPRLNGTFFDTEPIAYRTYPDLH